MGLKPKDFPAYRPVGPWAWPSAAACVASLRFGDMFIRFAPEQEKEAESRPFGTGLPNVCRFCTLVGPGVPSRPWKTSCVAKGKSKEMQHMAQSLQGGYWIGLEIEMPHVACAVSRRKSCCGSNGSTAGSKRLVARDKSLRKLRSGGQASRTQGFSLFRSIFQDILSVIFFNLFYDIFWYILISTHL